MWWGRTDRFVPSGVSATPGPGGLAISGSVRGPSGGFLSLNTASASLRVVGQYFLDTNRMPTGGCEFRSAPSARLTGDVVGLTFGGVFLFGPNPTTTCTLMARQLVFSGGSLIASSTSSQSLVSIVDREFSLQRTAVPSNPFSPVDFDLARDRNLAIHLEVVFSMFFRGDGLVRFSPFVDSPPFRIDLPQWDIHSIT